MSERIKRFRRHGPGRECWNADEIPPDEEAAAWQDVLDFVARVKPEELLGFYVGINVKPRPKVKAARRGEAKGGV